MKTIHPRRGCACFALRCEPLRGRLERLRARFSGYGEPVRDYLSSLKSDEEIHCGPIDWLELDRWHIGRVVLIADAAHASSPMMGQGGCMAMEDGWVLAEVLRSAASAGRRPDLGCVESALDRFSARRRRRVDWIQRESRAVGEMLSRPSEVRNAVLRQRGSHALYERFRPLIAPP